MATPVEHPQQLLPTIAFVGRVNVGKSTLFNRFIEEHKAIVSDIPGTTRTRNFGVVLWRGEDIRLIDTGGLTFDDAVPLEEEIAQQTEIALQEANLIALVLDGKVGILPGDRTWAKRLRRAGKPVIVVVNKIDRAADATAAATARYESLGLGKPFFVSGRNGRNTGDVLDALFHQLTIQKMRPDTAPPEAPSAPVRIALIGKPNVGKSSLFNKLIGEERVIVSPLPHTTREPHDMLVLYEQEPMLFVDTAGIRRKAAVSGELEKKGITKSIQAIADAQIVLLVIDGSVPIASQDLQLGGLIERKAKSVIILVNKWDLTDDVSDTKRHAVERMVLSHFPHLDFAPILFVSGKTGYRVHQIFPAITRAIAARRTEIPEETLRGFLKAATRAHRPSRGKGTRHPELTAMKQIDTNPPVFELFVKYRTSVHPSYIRYIERRLRDQFEFFATPIVIKLTKLKR